MSYLPKEELAKNPKCYRTVCQNPHGWWWNTSTRRYYCQSCMLKITAWPENENIFKDHRFNIEARVPETQWGY